MFHGRGACDSACMTGTRAGLSVSLGHDGGLAGPSTWCAHDRPSLPDPVGHADHGQNAVWMGWSQPSLSEFAAAVLAQPETGPWFGEGLATRQAGDVLLGGASGAGSLLLNTKASQEAACSRAPAAIVPGRNLSHATQV